MIEKDYILRLLNQFFDDLSLFLSKKKKENDWASFYNTYFGDCTFYHLAEHDEILNSFNKYSATEKLYRMEMLAELYFQEAHFEIIVPNKLSLCKRSLMLLEYINMNSDTYSIKRNQRINIIKSILQEMCNNKE